MPIFSISPSVEIKETDLSLIVPAVGKTIGAFSGVFTWGPVKEPVLVDSEKTLVSIFGEPNQETATDFFTAASYLTYSKNLRVVRVVGQNAKNAYNGGSVAPTIGNMSDYEAHLSSANANNVYFIAKYPGSLGNSLKVSIADSNTYQNWEYRTLFGSPITINKIGSINAGSTTVTFASSENLDDLAVGAKVEGFGIPQNTQIVSIDIQNSEITLSNAATQDDASVLLAFTLYTGTPKTSSYIASKGGSNDELHVVIVDELGFWTGVRGTVLERYENLSKAHDAKDFSGSSSYYVNVLNRNSKYVWFGGLHKVSDWGGPSTTHFSSLSAPQDGNFVLSGGQSDNNTGVTLGIRMDGYEIFSRAEEIDVSLVIVAGLDSESDQKILANYIISDVVEKRKDCLAFISPPKNAVVNNKGNELQSILKFRNELKSSSYAVLNSGWKLMYDRYNDQMRWIPLSADIAGLCAYTDSVADPWFSPAGLNRGFIKNVIRLAYNPGSKAERDALYANGVNPVISQIGEGVILYGDKTLLSKPSAFDRINVRRLFILLEKAIATAAKYQLFEFNDEFTRGRFVGMVEPYLRDIKGRRGIFDFKVVCDSSNNTPQVIDNNGFVADIYIKPARSINFIQLNFVASPTGISFNEIA